MEGPREVPESPMAWERRSSVPVGGRRGGELALQHAARDVRREDKADDSPVTVANREYEQLIVWSCARHFPGRRVPRRGGRPATRPERTRWIVDPIDGTGDFVRGLGTGAT